MVYRVDPAQDRLTNFWLVLHDGTGDRVLYRWAYYDQGRPEDICELLDQQPDRVVVTADDTAGPLLESTCGHAVRVRRVRS